MLGDAGLLELTSVRLPQSVAGRLVSRAAEGVVDRAAALVEGLLGAGTALRRAELVRPAAGGVEKACRREERSLFRLKY